MSILVDTGAWYAVANRSDRHHADARRFYTQYAPEGSLVTTTLIVAETCSLLSARLGHPAALTFWQTLRETRIPVLTVDAVDLEGAWHISQAFQDQAFSFVDCTTFALMERTGIVDAFAFDAHFLVYRYGPERRRSLRRLPA